MTKCKLSPPKEPKHFTLNVQNVKEHLPAIEICSSSRIDNPSLNRKDYRLPWIHLVSLLHKRSKALLLFSTVNVDE